MGRVAVLHPDLGVGGAERLIVDASKALQESGHQVHIFTGYHDRQRCFEETRDGTLKTTTVGAWIPRAIFGKGHALLAYIKMIYIAFYLMLTSRHDLVLCDQVSACIPFLKLDLRNRPRVVFYCHFPDQLLTKRQTLLKSLYRAPIDWFEEWSTSMADVILVNSKFTSSVVKRTFKSLRAQNLTVLYPCVNVDSFVNRSIVDPSDCSEAVARCEKLSKSHYMFLSLNRFERKKNLALAIEALSECILGFRESNQDEEDMKVHLIVAGGYDTRLEDCITYYKDLEKLVLELDLEKHVSFVQSPSDTEKLLLLELSDVIIYTPENEHFGIVPLEAMAMSKPVVASKTGGPLETIENEVNGLLCESDKYSFADALLRLYNKPELGERMGLAGLKRVRHHFSYETFRERLNKICYLDQ